MNRSAPPVRESAREEILARGSSFLSLFVRHRKLLLWPAVICFGLSVVYVVLGPKRWRATQVFHLRDEMIGRQHRPGHFESLDDMKTAQETILEIARNPSVVRRCLEHVNPGDSPSTSDIESTQGTIQVSSSNGAELGKTELIRLTVTESSSSRAESFCDRLAAELETELRSVRFNRASSMWTELNKAAESAQASLTETAQLIAQFEKELGPDLGDLRNLIEPNTGDNLLYKNLAQITTELRAAELNLETVNLQKSLLESSLQDIDSLVATPNELLTLQPAIARLKDGLVDAQLKLAELRGDYHDNHPKIVAANAAVTGIQNALRQELGLAIRGLNDQGQIISANLAHLSVLNEETRRRLETLTTQRVIYDQLNAEFKRRDGVLRDAQAALAQAASIKAAAKEVDFLTRVNHVQVASRPEGLSKRSVVAATTFLGLIVGAGLVMLLHGPLPQGAWPQPPPMPERAANEWPDTGPSTSNAAPRPTATKILPVETADQLLDRSSFAVTVMPASFLLSKPQMD